MNQKKKGKGYRCGTRVPDDAEMLGGREGKVSDSSRKSAAFSHWQIMHVTGGVCSPPMNSCCCNNVVSPAGLWLSMELCSFGFAFFCGICVLQCMCVSYMCVSAYVRLGMYKFRGRAGCRGNADCAGYGGRAGCADHKDCSQWCHFHGGRLMPVSLGFRV